MGGAKPRKNGGPKGGDPEGWGAKNFALFCSSLAAMFVLSSLSGSSRGTVAAIKGRGPPKMRGPGEENKGGKKKPRKKKNQRRKKRTKKRKKKKEKPSPSFKAPLKPSSQGA